jgi:peptidoglycan/xylan/chitin deacetylase (PgdA/CDA1 family)
MMSNRAKLAKFADRLGVTRLIASLAKSRGLLVLCYHRIGDPAAAEYSQDLYSATAESFHDQVSYLKATYGIATLEEALAGPRAWSKGARVLLTFDDAYLDSYTVAYPILKSLGVQGTFLLPTKFIGTNIVPWWDGIAQMIARTRERYVRVPSLTDQVFDRTVDGAAEVACQLLRLYRESNQPDAGRVLEEVAASTGLTPPLLASQRVFLSWTEAREMLHGGMAIGSHSHSHPLIGGLNSSQQKSEAVMSRRRIIEELQIKPRVFALPCGSCSEQTARILAEAGYEMSLSTEPGSNLAAAWDPFRVRRILVDHTDVPSSTRLRMAMMAGLGNL